MKKNNLRLSLKKRLRRGMSYLFLVAVGLFSGLSSLRASESTSYVGVTSVPQETERVRGVVTDDKGHPLPGVTVLIKGTMLGTVSDGNGAFELSLSEPIGKVLVFSFIGMDNKEVKIEQPDKPLSVVLKEASEKLGEVVVTGIFSRKKESFTGAATTYTSNELKQVGNQNIIQSLKTLDPSLLVMDSKEWGSDPNRLPDMEIRGKTSIAGFKEEYGTDPNQPLFILDGFETTLEAIMNLSLDRVASVTILKRCNGGGNRTAGSG